MMILKILFGNYLKVIQRDVGPVLVGIGFS